MEEKYRIYTVCYEGVKTYVIFTNMMEIVLLIFYSMGQEERFNSKIERKVQMYKDCPIKYENGQSFIDYINANRYLLKSRPQCYQHGDYHVGNMMIDDDGKLQIIDFDRSDFGDPWKEFDRIAWCAQKSPLFCFGYGKWLF